ncbi:uncharacterized protein LOC125269909 isoform X2 [Megalobrama amblycephala]|uniref:uncharacterized protein LOC125269909 isoform X2 n=1 Tax=Megalobrama amblycephala TaxID=75352 RepID=UPI002013C18D|nr:uncharacterized protein LOC125269909 isoform X2 [Megalobrama amblycephala]
MKRVTKQHSDNQYKGQRKKEKPKMMLENGSIEGKYFIIDTGKTSSVSRNQILHRLHQQRPGLKEVHTVRECDVILVFCTISSRVGTDIDAALKDLNNCSASKPAIFMVLHHTFEPEKMIPDSSRYVTRMNTLTVDCLFNEDQGLLNCIRNDEALNKIAQPFKLQEQWKWNMNVTVAVTVTITIIILIYFFSSQQA